MQFNENSPFPFYYCECIKQVSSLVWRLLGLLMVMIPKVHLCTPAFLFLHCPTPYNKAGWTVFLKLTIQLKWNLKITQHSTSLFPLCHSALILSAITNSKLPIFFFFNLFCCSQIFKQITLCHFSYFHFLLPLSTLRPTSTPLLFLWSASFRYIWLQNSSLSLFIYLGLLLMSTMSSAKNIHQGTSSLSITKMNK